MGAIGSRLLTQPTTAWGSAGIGVLALGVTGASSRFHLALTPAQAGVALCVVVAAAASYTFPVHIWHSMKICVGSIGLYLLAVLLPPPLAAACIGAAVVGGNLLVRADRGSYPSDIATDGGRWLLIGTAGSVVAHATGVPTAFHSLPMVGAAAVLWLGDILTGPLLYCPISAERPAKVVMTCVREAGATEAGLYLVAMLGAMAAVHEIWAIVLIVPPALLIHLAFKSRKELHSETRRILESMADTVDLRDPYTGGHSRRVSELSQGILQAMGKSGPEVELIVDAARVHDIGKLGIPDSVLLKPGKLTPEERAIIETHSERGAELLQRYPDFARGADIIRHHHEAWDGTGYPDRIAGTDIPIGARIIAVADSYDAMTSDRPYRKGMAPAEAAEILRKGRARQWDPTIVDAFLLSIAELILPSEPPAEEPQHTAISA